MGISPANIGSIILFLTISAITSSAESSPSGNDIEMMSHVEQGCSACHERDLIRERNPQKITAGDLQKDPVDLCRDCHSGVEASHHPVNVKTGEPASGHLPLSKTGTITCATCHDVHARGETEFLLRGYTEGIFINRLDLCLECHGEQLHTMNPHRANIDKELCHVCHESTPGEDTSFETVKLTEESFKKCNFCHNVKSKKHPENVELLASLPLFLPRDNRGRINCNTCHNPHNIEGTLFFLRKDYIEFIESDRYENPHGLESHRDCEKCHAEVLAENTLMPTNLRYKDDDIQICFSCHGAMNLCHPILVKPTSDMKPIEGMRFSREGEIICLTCHDPTPGSESGTGLRRGKFGGKINQVCAGCHPKTGIFQNPHKVQSENDSCTWCHDTIGSPAREDATRVSLIANPRLICLRCHPENLNDHPAGKNHFLVPTMEIPEGLKLDYKGRITCTTCHRPGIEHEEDTAVEQMCVFFIGTSTGNICARCHKKI